jgi:hypothetical protein
MTHLKVMKIQEFCLEFFNIILKICRTSMKAERDVITGGGGDTTVKMQN